MAKFTTYAGIEPDVDRLPFTITTSMAKNFLQKKVDIAVDSYNSIAKSKNWRTISPACAEIDLVSSDAGKNFAPFIVALDTALMKNGGNNNNNRNNNNGGTSILSLVENTGNDNHVTLIDDVARVFTPFIFNKDDGNAFTSDVVRRQLEMNRNTAFHLRNHRTPVVSKIGKNGVPVVIFIIDPIKLFHEMLMSDEYRSNFVIAVDGFHKINSGEYSYNLTRRVRSNNKKKKYGDSVAEDIAYKFSGRNTGNNNGHDGNNSSNDHHKKSEDDYRRNRR